jgi:hypothetical protein
MAAKISFLEGFELGEEYLAASTSGTWSFDTTTVRTGTYSLKINPSSNRGYYSLAFSYDSAGEKDLTTAYTYWCVRFYFRFASAVAGDTVLADVGGDSVYLTSANKLKYSSTTGTEVLSTDTWYRIEIREDGSNVVTRINGTQDISVSTTGSSATLGLGQGSGTYTCEFYYDDVAISASDTSGDVDWIGAGGITLLAANANGTDTEWTGTYADVDEVPPNEDTDYWTTSSGGKEETANLENTSGKIYGTIKAVQGQIIIRAEGAGTDKWRFRHTDDGTSAELDQVTDGDTTYHAHCRCSDVDVGGSAWTTTALDAYEVGAATDGGASQEMRVTHVSAQVEHAGEAKAIGDFGSTTKRTMIDGFELGENGISNYQIGAAITWDTSTVRTGTYSQKVNPSAAAAYARYEVSWNADGTRSTTTFDFVTTRFYFRTTDATPSSDVNICSYEQSSALLKLKTTGYLDFDGTTGTNQLSDNTWHLIEIIYDSVWDKVFVKVDGNNDITDSISLSSQEYVYIGTTSSATCEHYYDDLAIFATDDPDQVGWLGDGEVKIMLPDGNSATDTDWTASAGNKNECVDEVPPNEDTDYVSTSTSGHAYSATTANLSGEDTINAVQGIGQFKQSSAGEAIDHHDLRVRYSSSTTDTTGDDSTSYAILGNCLNEAPDGSAWTPTILDSTEVGAVASGSVTHYCSHLSLHVDYVASAGATSTSDEFGAVIHGTTSGNSEYGATITGKIAESDSFGAVIDGQDSGDSEYDAVIHGTTSGNSEYDSVIFGKSSSNDEYDSIIWGKSSDSDSFESVIFGKSAPQTDSYDSVIYGWSSGNSNFQATTWGYSDDSDSYTATVFGKDSSDNSVSSITVLLMIIRLIFLSFTGPVRVTIRLTPVLTVLVQVHPAFSR